MTTRFQNQPKTPSTNWDQLMGLAIQRAKLVGDSRLGALQMAQTKGQAQEFLKRFSIVSEKDLVREFPTKE